MRLYIQEKDSLLKFNLPAKIEGSMLFSFSSSNGLNNSINIDAVDGKWVFKSNGNINIIGSTNSVIEEVVLSDYMCVPISINGVADYVCVFCLPSIEENYCNYTLGDATSISIGKSADNNIVYQQNMMADHHAVIRFENNNWFLYPLSDNPNICIYVNNHRILKTTPIFAGDIIFMNGLRIVWMKKSFIIPMAEQLFVVNGFSLSNGQGFIDNTKYEATREIDENISLFTENDCFSHTPRIRSEIEEEEVTVDGPPPKEVDNSSTPLLLSIGASITVFGMMFTNSFALYNGISSGEKDFTDFLPQIVMIVTMLIASLFVPILTNMYSKKYSVRKEKNRQERYGKYLLKKEKEISGKIKKQEQILINNHSDYTACIEMIQKRTSSFWNRVIKDSDFLKLRLGIGDRPAKLILDIPQDKFSLDDDDLYNAVLELGKKYSMLNNVPITIDLKENTVISTILQNSDPLSFINGIMLQLLSFHSPLDLKIVVLTDESKNYRWNYLKYTSFTWNDDYSVRFYASTLEDYKSITQFLSNEFSIRLDKVKSQDNDNTNNSSEEKPEPYESFDTYYLILTDCFRKIQNFKFIKDLLDTHSNLGFSMLILDKDMKNTPNECEKFLVINDSESGMFNSNVLESETIKFKAESVSGLNMRQVARLIGNVPIQSKNEDSQLPTSISFLQMYGVGKIEQLNVKNRWIESDPINSLAVPIGVHSNGELFYLDLHEKNDGPHGLIAGSTGSGKSEFIITYLLSLALNYDPKEVQFVLIDYKGGGLTGAFENRDTGISIPHLAGTITNLDVSEMNRTLVSIQSELKRRQHQFNVVKEQTGESTMDIYKYQRLYREGVIDEPVSHLFIVSDEFAELKAQQPEFMDQLVSTARIGRSLGVHLILATQKPSGVVNDQIWSNSKFKVCLKVATVEDSREMLKRPEAASIKEAGRFYLQVGYDEYFDIGQSAWAGENYVPTERIMVKKDDSVCFVSNSGSVLKTASFIDNSPVQKGNRGDQLTNIVKYLYELSKNDGFVIKKLWLPSLADIVLLKDLIAKYSIQKSPIPSFKVVLGEYDAPAFQKQGPVIYDYLKDANTCIYSTDGKERESLLSILIYATALNYSAENVNIYIFDFGSEALRVYQKLPHVGGIVFNEELDKFNSLVRLIRMEMDKRKSIFADYGGEYLNYFNNSSDVKKLPLMIVVINNFDAFAEVNGDFVFDILPKLMRDSERYGIVYIVTAIGVNSLNSRIAQYIPNSYAFKLKDSMDYGPLFESRSKIVPKNVFGRGICKNDDFLNEFQCASIVEDESTLNAFILDFVNKQKEINKIVATPIPVLPDFVRLANVETEISTLDNVPVGIDKTSFSIINYNFMLYKGTFILSKKVGDTFNFVKSLLYVLHKISDTNLVVIDALKTLDLAKNIFPNYYNDNYSDVANKVIKYVAGSAVNNINNIVIINGFSNFSDMLGDNQLLKDFIETIGMKDNFRLILVDDFTRLKSFTYEDWCLKYFNMENGIWIGNGLFDQNLFKLSRYESSSGNLPSDFGYAIIDGDYKFGRLLDFITEDKSKDSK